MRFKMPFFRNQSLTKQLLIIVLLALIIPAAVMLYDIFYASKTEDVLIKQNETKLIRITDLTHEQIIDQYNDVDLEYDNHKLTDIFKTVADPLVKLYPGVRICFYEKSTDNIIILGYLHDFGMRLPEEKKERERRIYNETKAGISAVLAGGTPITRLGKTYDDMFLEYLVPVNINDQTVAVIWAEEMMHPMFAQSSRVRLVLRYVIFSIFGLGAAASLITIFGLVSRIRTIKDGTIKLESDLNNNLPVMHGEMGQITAAINKMARGLAEKEQLLEQYRRSENLIAMGRTITEIAHELRAPISVIQATAQAIQLNFQDTPQLTDFLNRIEQQVERHSKLINELLDFGRPDPGIIETLDLNELINSVLEANKPLLLIKNINVDTANLGQKPLIIKGNAEKLKQVFINLIINALEAMNKNGTLTISTNTDNGEAVVSVHDTGAGIPSEELANIFEPFYTGKAKGNGLGLAISKRIIQIHGGTIEVESEKGSGSKFTFRLPLGGKE